jgi:transketolase
VNDLHLSKGLASESTREGFGRGLLQAGQADENVVALCADLTESTKMHFFAEAFPERFIEMGVAEQNLVTVGSGLAAMGKIPFVSSYAAFSPGRNWEQIRTTIALNNQPVKIVGSHAGLYTGADGATHQMLEDISIMRAMPNMVVLAPGDSLEAAKMTLAMAGDKRPNYMRLARENTPVMTTEKTPFQIGRAYVYKSGADISLISTGVMTYQAMIAAASLAKDGVHAEVIHVPTIKPIDHQVILSSAEKTRHVVTIEEGQINGGLGGAVAELLGENLPTPMIRVGMNDSFGQSGQPSELLKHYGLTPAHIAMTAHSILMDHSGHKH